MSETIIPIANPRSCALVGLSFPPNQNEYEKRWRKLQESLGAPLGASDEQKNEAQREVMDRVALLQQQGHDYNTAWNIATTTPPTKAAFEVWSGGAAQKRAAERDLALSNEQQQSGARFQTLLAERAQLFPNESYHDCWSAVAGSEAGQTLIARMKHAD